MRLTLDDFLCQKTVELIPLNLFNSLEKPLEIETLTRLTDLRFS
jgi:hypothetical protein